MLSLLRRTHVYYYTINSSTNGWIHMEAILLRMLSLLRRTHVYYINRTVSFTCQSPFHRSYCHPDRFSTAPAISSTPARSSALARSSELGIPGYDLPDWHGSYRPRWPSTGDSRDMWSHVYPERAGIPELERGCHSSLGSSGDIRISHLGVSHGHQNVPNTLS